MHCLPQLKAMIAWYGASQSGEDTLHEFHFVRGVRPNGGGYFVVNFAEVDRYLAFLRQSNFFTEKYMAAERHDFEESQATFLAIKQTDGEPNGFALDRMFGVADIIGVMNYNQYNNMWQFKPGASANTIVFDTGESARTITFDSNCKIDIMEDALHETQVSTE